MCIVVGVVFANRFKCLNTLFEFIVSETTLSLHLAVMVNVVHVNYLLGNGLVLRVICLVKDLRRKLVLLLAVCVCVSCVSVLRFSHACFRFPVCSATECHFCRVFVISDRSLLFVSTTEDA